ncbi:MAG: glycosyltransferase [Chitinispirillales bacterium]|nr:glycosyltransferase [Chitinispirillales bacterium]
MTIAFIAALFKKERASSHTYTCGELPGVSIVIPFRNEEHNLKALLSSIENQSYSGAFEVIFVNDRSDDKGPEIIKEYSKSKQSEKFSVKLIDLEKPDNKLTSKQQALDIGISYAAYPLVAFTDADMILKQQWLESLTKNQLSSGADLIFGHTAVRAQAKGALAKLESFQLAFLFSYACGFSKLNLMGSCMGNNLLVTKKSYLKCGGQRAVGYNIVEDRALMGLMRKNGFKTKAAETFCVTAITHPSTSLFQFWQQMRRWAAGGLRLGEGLFAAGLLLATQNFLLILSTTGLMPPLITILTYVNFFLTWIFLTIAFKKNGSTSSPLYYPIYFIFLNIMAIVFALSLIIKPRIIWKGRKV